MNTSLVQVPRRAKILASFFLVYSLMFLGANKTFASTQWKENVPSDTSYTYNGLASSADGKYLAAIGTNIFLSSDYGTHWHSRGDEFGDNWTALASSGDGQEVAYINLGGYLYVTLDGGTDWSSGQCINGSCSGRWTSLTMSADGQHLAAANVGGYQVWTSDDFGSTWADASPNLDHWQAVAYSPDGGTLVAAANSQGSGYFAVSANNGADWTTGLGPGGIFWASVVAGNGGKLAASGYFVDVWTSADGGTNWNDTGFGADLSLQNNTLASSYNGKVLVAAGDNTDAYISIDSGATWKDQTAPGNNTWGSVAASSNGSRLAVGGYHSIWTYNKDAISRRSSGSSAGSLASFRAQQEALGAPVVAPVVVPVTPPQPDVITPHVQAYMALFSTLKLGSHGDEVKSLQNSLKLSIDGIFGPKTKIAVIDFQKLHGLTADGVVGPKTRKALGF